VYASLNGYRWDDFAAYLYVSNDYGQNWERIGLELPLEPINVVREDPANADVLYVGTDHNVYISLDRGKTFQTLSADFPDCPVHDLAIQPKTKHLIIGTHGRSMFKADISNVQKLTPEVLASTVTLFEIEKRKFNKNWGKKPAYEAAKDPELPVWFYANAAGKATWTVKTKEGGLILNSGSANCAKGLNSLNYNLDVQETALKKYKENLQAAQKDTKKPVEIEKADTGKFYLRKGIYIFTVEKDGKTSEQEFAIE
jgi:hypothetical protein